MVSKRYRWAIRTLLLFCSQVLRVSSIQRSRHLPINRAAFTEAALLSDSSLWALRVSSAVLSYAGFVAFLDRPRGQLLVGPEVEIKESTVKGAGLGLFATQDLTQGTVLGTYPGVVVPLQQNLGKLQSFPQCEGYIWRFSDNRFVIDPTNRVGNIESVCVGGNPSMPGSLWFFENIITMTTPTTLCRINEPPLGKDVNVVTNEDLKARTVQFVLERDVAMGEEFFIDYGLSYDRSMYGSGN